MLTAAKPYLNGRSGSVMTVRNIERRYVFKPCGYKINRVIVRHNPDSFTDIIGHKIINRLAFFFYIFNSRRNLVIFSVCQKYRTGVCVKSVNVPYAVRFLIGSCLFVLFDDVVYIIVNSRTAYNAGLRSAAPGLLIYIQARFFVLLHNLRRNKLRQILACFFIDTVVIDVNRFRKIYLRLINMQK